jgi:hypothetical protein
MGLLEQLHDAIDRGPFAAALIVRYAAAQDPDAAAVIADNTELDMPIRIAALLALAFVAEDGARVPDLALGVLEDDLFVDAAIACDASGAITGIIHAAGDRVDVRTRRYLALRLKAASASGVHVAALLLSVDDLDGAVRAASPVFAVALRDVSADDPLALALATIVVDWARGGTAIAELIAASLPSELRATLVAAVQNVAPDERQLIDALR